jgi:hypothetical protein
MRLNEFLKMFFVSDVEVRVNVIGSPVDSFNGCIEDIPESIRTCEVLNFGSHLDYFIINVRKVD